MPHPEPRYRYPRPVIGTWSDVPDFFTQLGAPYRGAAALPSSLQRLFAGLHAHVQADEQASAASMLQADELLQCAAPVDDRLVSHWLARAEAALLELRREHAYERTMALALYRRAREVGGVAAGRWRWLRAAEPTLHEALLHLQDNVVPPRVLGLLGHYRQECRAGAIADARHEVASAALARCLVREAARRAAGRAFR